ncbi:probable disease resistance protein At4g27220 [Dioscorea cayenensis subsp. rotundata]|uniref:Probable disease resistance protein At4g27220 n=1 Tax=Dioscorea cayennensis subsp. rotundata TaxID=55577 RepID=A0AB40AV64_DIOCR|nr:probable disease resistance protein At4g27220 [Dioscorea cayenensis subsp. rotundata]XP_039118871.1 probable disease resistance protein At4g27220 [Dioscorea cayenensis subsp. rotundata]XP_039118872.1 probable disease resistance protein At4g27220 [Dioscorea cayenensis subsp. rotundata]
MESLITITTDIVKHAWSPISRHLGYLICYTSKIEKLESIFNKLDDLQKDVQERVNAARRERLEEATREVRTWLCNVNNMKGEVQKIKLEASSTLTSNNCFQHIKLRYKLGREAAHHIKNTDDLIIEGKFDSVSHKRPPPSTTDSLLYNEDFVIFDSRKSRVKKILEALKDDAVHSIGLWGMGGVGKTMLVKDVAKQAKEQSLFGEVMMVTVSQNIDLKRIQTVMAESLGLHLSDESVEVRAVKLADKLETTDNKVLVILDDLWETLDLSMVRIPRSLMGTTCKVVITTRNKNVCGGMKCREIIELKTLSDEESWILFKNRAGDAVESPTIRKLAQKVAKECAGLPLALVVLGTTLKDKSSLTWDTVLNQLKGSKEVYLQGVSKQVYQSIKLSFDFLEIEAAKSCFLHCCVYPEDWEIPKEELMHMMAGGGLLADVETLNEAQSRVDLLLDQLKACGLLLQGRDERYVRMHDVVRDVAIHIGDVADHAFYTRAGQGLTGWPRTTESDMRNCRRLSLMHNDIEDLPPDPMQYPKLEMMILSFNRRLISIPEMFFLHMGSLMILDLSCTDIKSLPKSFSYLTNLRILNLSGCRSLKDISHINGLKMLEILILVGCPVSIVPEAVGCAQSLRFLNLSLVAPVSSCLDIFFSKELPRFHRLEQLFMVKFAGSFQELISLRHLTHLFITKVVDLDDSLSHELVLPDSWPDRLLKFSLCFVEGLPMNFFFGQKSRALRLMGTKPLAVWVKKLLEKTRQLALVEFQKTELISINSDIPPLVFSSLESLDIMSWPKLTKLLDDELSLQEEIPLSQLQHMIISNCPGLTNLIPSRFYQRSMLPGLRDLQLSLLQSLHNVLQPFQCLPNLTTLYIDKCGVRYVVSSEMETVAILADPFPALDNLEINNCKEMIEMISPPASLQVRCFFQRLRQLQIYSCPRLKHLFTYEQAIGMQHLKKLDIRYCAALEAVVISTENKEEASSSTHVADHESYNSPFPNLTDLKLNNLPQLTAFHHPTPPPVEWLHLQSYSIRKCPKLQEPLEERVQSLWARMNEGEDSEEEDSDDL